MATDQNDRTPKKPRGPQKRKEALEEQRERLRQIVMGDGKKGAKVVQKWLDKPKGAKR